MARLRCHLPARCPPTSAQSVAVWIIYTLIFCVSCTVTNPVDAAKLCRNPTDDSVDNNDQFPVDHRYDALRAAGQVAILYHQTSPEHFEAIMARGQLQSGRNFAHNYAGPGIYFTTTPEATHHKARHKGVVLKCEVLLGRLKIIETRNTVGNWALGEAERAAHDYDSIEIASLNGAGYIVYDPARIISFEKLDSMIEDEEPEFDAEFATQPESEIVTHRASEPTEFRQHVIGKRVRDMVWIVGFFFLLFMFLM